MCNLKFTVLIYLPLRSPTYIPFLCRPPRAFSSGAKGFNGAVTSCLFPRFPISIYCSRVNTCLHKLHSWWGFTSETKYFLLWSVVTQTAYFNSVLVQTDLTVQECWMSGSCCCNILTVGFHLVIWLLECVYSGRTHVHVEMLMLLYLQYSVLK